MTMGWAPLLILFVIIFQTNALVVKITQTNAVIDANPVINLTEVQIFMNDEQLSLSAAQLSFSQPSIGHPAALCVDGVTTAGAGSSHICKSGHTNPDGQSLSIDMGDTLFNRIKIFNVHGKTSSDQDARERMKGATLSVLSGGTITHRENFATAASVYEFSIPSHDLPPNQDQKHRILVDITASKHLRAAKKLLD